LLFFVRHPGRAFSKRELMATLWPDSFVEKANLSFQAREQQSDAGRESVVSATVCRAVQQAS
jgi:DNA-binding winged helix-turn-helix (wHTH) protein